MKHTLASHPLVRPLATVVATLLGQAFADGLDRAPILPKTHAAPAPCSPAPTTLRRDDEALLAAFLACVPPSPTERRRLLVERVRDLLAEAPGPAAVVHSRGHGASGPGAAAPRLGAP